MPLIELNLSKDILHSEPATSEVGNLGEQIAADYLRRRGFRIVAMNFRVPIGRNRKGASVFGEIDIIAIEDPVLSFIEVKTRSKPGLTNPLSSIDLRKQRQIIRTARVYRRIFGVEKIQYRFDAVGIVLRGQRAPEVDLRRGFFDAAKFAAKSWRNEY